MFFRFLMKIEAFIQARMGSTRLPGKVLMEVKGKPLLGILVERLSRCHQLDQVVILTSNESCDYPIVDFCSQHHIPFFRGTEEDVLKRYYDAAVERNVDSVVRITSDCPLMDPKIVDQLVTEFRNSRPQCDYLSNTLKRTYPRGLDIEVFSFNALKIAHENAQRKEEREHVTLYMYRHPDKFLLKNSAHIPSLEKYRLTVDTKEDFELIRLILEHFYPDYSGFTLEDIVNLLVLHPSWLKINAHIEQKKI